MSVLQNHQYLLKNNSLLKYLANTEDKIAYEITYEERDKMYRDTLKQIKNASETAAMLIDNRSDKVEQQAENVEQIINVIHMETVFWTHYVNLLDALSFYPL